MLELGKGLPTVKFRARNWTEKMKRSSAFLLFALILFLLSSLITITQGGKILQGWYYETVGRQSKVLRDVKLLAPGMNIDYFISKLGSPIFINSENLTLAREGSPITEKSYVFDLRPLFVVASVDKEGKVLAYSVTSPDSSVNPSLILPNEYGEVVLGKTRFSDLDEITGGPFSIAGSCGARRVSYDEQYYYGNPGNYQYYIFSFNDMGLSTGLWKVNGTDVEPSETKGVTQLCDLSDDGLLVPTELSGDIGWDCRDCNLKTDKVRKVRQEIINTYTVTAPFVDSSQLSPRYGPDSDQIRLLPWY